MDNRTPLPDDCLLLTFRDVCRLARISKNTFYAMKQAGQFNIPPVRLRSCVRYSRKAVEGWILSGCSPHYKGGCR